MTVVALEVDLEGDVDAVIEDVAAEGAVGEKTKKANGSRARNLDDSSKRSILPQ